MVTLLPSRAIAISIGGWSIYWYAIIYILAFGLTWWLVPKLQHYRGLTIPRERWLEIVTWALGGALIGGRLGYVLFYEPTYFLAHPAAIFALWQGGMSAHGGFIGVAVAVWLAVRPVEIPWLALLDCAVVPAALGLALGRVGNWINQELFVSTAAYLLVIGKDVVIAAITYLALRRFKGTGSTTAIFLIMYAGLRFVSEYVRIQPFPEILGLTRGQLLCIPLMIIGVWLFITSRTTSILALHRSPRGY